VTSLPRPRMTTDPELLVLTRICDLLGTLTREGQHRVIAYILQRKDTLPVHSAAEANGVEDVGLFADRPGNEPASGETIGAAAHAGA
jgi:hypothetical protein